MVQENCVRMMYVSVIANNQFLYKRILSYLDIPKDYLKSVLKLTY